MPSLLNLKYSLRSLKQNKFTLFINIFGFSVSLAFVIMIGLYINREYSVDDFHVDKERIFRIDQANVDEYTGFPIQFAEDLAAAFPEVDKILRIVEGDVDIQIPTGERFVQRVMFTDNSLFSVFSFDLKEGDAGSVLLTQKDIVLSETFASRLFGSEPAIGKSLFMGADSMEYFTVSGVVRDFGNSHLVCPDVIMSLEYERNNKYMKPYYKGYQMWNSDTYVKAVRGSNLPSKQDEINDYFSKYTNALWSDTEKSNGAHIEVVPVTDIYFTGRCGDFGRCNDKDFLSVMIVTALLILIFAGINYLNMSVSQSGFRAKSAAIQRLLGSSKGDMFWGFITESVGVCLVSGIIAILLAWIAYPWFGRVMSADLAFGENVGWWGMVSFVVVILVIGTLSGWIPATVISSFKPIEVARGTLRRKTKTVYSKVLITFQYTITTILLGCTIIIARQIDYMQNSDLGFDSENVIAFSYDRNNFTSRQSVEHTLRAIPGVENVSSCSDFPTSVQNSFIYRDKEGVVRYVQRFYADTNFVSVLGIPVLYEHVNNGYWFNETIAKRIGLTEESLVYADNGIYADVKGVVKDFHIHDFSHAIDEVWT
ncbi:MAG: ABC transporter permease, partial [Rikenellaceae bacterium]|nr:ABC transporter permease [Rikenellaceae bacterium]